MAAEKDIEALRRSRNFMMIYPHAAVTSCLLEAGYALIADMPSFYFVRNTDDLPYMMRGALEDFPNRTQAQVQNAERYFELLQKIPR